MRGFPCHSSPSSKANICQIFCQWLKEQFQLEYYEGFHIEYIRIVRTYIETNDLLYNLIVKCRDVNIADSIIRLCEDKKSTTTVERYLSLPALRKRRKVLLNTGKTLKLFGHSYYFTRNMSSIVIDGKVFVYDDGKLKPKT